jgi:uncharacterized PurR-regulated membrane protein YhhQ (DUF165 family)
MMTGYTVHGVRVMAIAALAGFVLSIVGANWALARWGIVSIGFGLMAPAGVYFAGLAFSMRDAVRETLGRTGVIIAIAVGAGLSYLMEDAQTFAVASGVAFAFSETADALVYEPLRSRSWLAAVSLSNTVGVVVDSALFLWLAFGSLAFIEGQIVAKLYMTGAAVLAIAAWRARAVLSRHA